MTIELDQVTETIERMKAARPWCNACRTMSYLEAMKLCDTEYWPVMRRDMKAAGYEELTDRAGWGMRCDACATGELYPWADKLDPQRVLEFVNTDTRCQSAFALDILKETLPAYYDTFRITELAPDCPESVKRQLQERCDELNAECKQCGALDCTKSHAEFM